MGIAIIQEDFQMEDVNLVTVSDAAEKTGYTGAFIRLIANQGRIKAKKFGYMWQIDLDDLIS
ncbi:hypothetical protein GF348_24565, partial [candidate division KSB3 bacterium]|nr:hypothetical protein [candidate division KSB3 bacterium]